MAIWIINSKRIAGKLSFHDQFKKIIKHYKRAGYSMDVMRQFACLAINPITVYSYGFYGGSGLRLDDDTGIKLFYHMTSRLGVK